MKKKLCIVIALLALAMFALVSCAGETTREVESAALDEPPSIETEYPIEEDVYDEVTDEDTPEITDEEATSTEVTESQANHITAEEFGVIIVRGEQVFRDLIFPGFHMLQHQGEERRVPSEWGTAFGFHVLPSSGFESIEDIRAAFLTYYTEEAVDDILEWGISYYEEYNGMLYFFPYLACSSHWFWEDATFEIIEQEGNRSVVEVIVPASGEGMEWVETIHYTFNNDRMSQWRELIR